MRRSGTNARDKVFKEAGPSGRWSDGDGAMVRAMGTPYDQLGGEAGIRCLTHRFYELMDTLPEAAACRAVHPPDLANAEQRLFEYLSGWLGGPPLYIERHGRPMLRRRHLRAPIGGEEVRGWLLCFHRAWDEQVEDPALSREVMPQIEKLAHHMQNRGA